MKQDKRNISMLLNQTNEISTLNYFRFMNSDSLLFDQQKKMEEKKIANQFQNQLQSHKV